MVKSLRQFSCSVVAPILSFVLGFVALLGSAEAKEHFAADVAEFAAAVKTAVAGDEIVLRNGEWRDADLVFRGEGVDYKRPILLRAETPGQVLLTGKSRLRIGGKYLRVEGLLWKNAAAKDAVIAFRIDSKTAASRCIVSQCAILGDAPEEERKWVSMYGGFNGATNCRFEGKQSAGTLLVVWLPENGQPTDQDVRNNFFGPRTKLGKNGGEIIRVGDSKTSRQKAWAHVVGNYFYRCDGEAEIISNKSCENVYASNVFVGCSGALTFRHGSRCEASENAFFGDGRKGTGGVRVIGENHLVSFNLFHELTGDDARAAVSLMNGIPDTPLNGYEQVKQARVENNLFVDCKQSIVVGLRDDDQKSQTLPPKDCHFSNNAVVSKKGPVFVVHNAGTGHQHRSNDYFGDELGIERDDGWRRAVKLVPFDLAREQRLESNENGYSVTDFTLPVRPNEVGPTWLRPGDEYLPKVLRPK